MQTVRKIDISVRIPTVVRSLQLGKNSCGLAKIGASVGRDHASVLHGVKQTLYWSQTDKEFSEKYDLIKSLYKNAPSEVNFVVPKNEELVSLV